MEPIFHFLIPLLVLLALFPKLDRKIIWLLSPLAVFPDLDFYIGHRYLFHNIFFALLVSLVIFAALRRMKNFDTKKAKMAFVITFFFLFSHILLDFGGPGVGIFYPLQDKLVKLDFVVTANPAEYWTSYRFDINTNPLSEATKSQRSPAVTTSGLLLLAVFGIALAGSRVTDLRMKL